MRYSTDLNSHYIEGFAIHGGARLQIPLITEVMPNLWQGGCRDGVILPEDFGFVLSLYPWERYAISEGTERVEYRLLDSVEQELDDAFLDEVASLVNEKRAKVKTLVHCQAGLNRSGLITGLALMHSGMSADEAIKLMREQRDSAVLCNPQFEAYLRERTL